MGEGADQDVEDSDELFRAPLEGGPVIKLNRTLFWPSDDVLSYAYDLLGERVLYVADQDEDAVAFHLFSVRIEGTPSLRVSTEAVCGVSQFADSSVGDAIVYIGDNCDTSVQNELWSARLIGDGDGDGVLQGCDCAPLDSSTFSPPPEVSGLSFNGTSALTWTSSAPDAGASTVYDLLRGSTTELPVGNGSEVCLTSGQGLPEWSDPDAPPVGASFFYLVRATNACGVGTYGYASTAAERVSAACP